MDSVEDALQQLLKEVLERIRDATNVHIVTDALRSVASLLWSSSPEERTEYEHTTGFTSTSLDKLAELCTERAAVAFPHMPWRKVLNRVFFYGQSFSLISQLLLKDVAVNWVACFSLTDKKSLFDDFFTCSPPCEALFELIPALSQGYVATENGKRLGSIDNDSTSEASAGDDIHAAIRLEAERLLVIILMTKKGIKEISLSFSASRNFPEAVPPFVERRFSAVGNSSTEIAQLLSGIPDRASLRTPLALQSPDYFQGLTEQLLAAAEENWKSMYGESNSSRPADGDATSQFVGEVFAKLSRRGQGGVIASQMLPSLVHHVLVSTSESGVKDDVLNFSGIKWDQFLEKLQCSFWPSLATSFKDSYALERLTETFLKEMARRPDLRDWEAYCILQSFYGKLFRVQLAARILFTERLLLWKVLPVRCLRWVLAFAVLCAPPSSSPQSQPVGSTMQKDVVKRLVEAWAMREFVQSTPVQQQAYVTAAVGLCLEAMNRDDLQGIGDFVQFLLKGISNRLDSPLLPVRQMGKRIALAFSLSMDSNKPLLLDEEDSIEDLKNWEALEEMVSGNVKSAISHIEVKEASDRNNLTDVSNGTGGLNKSVNTETNESEDRRRRRERKQKLALEEDDPDAVVRLDEEYFFEDSEISSDSASDSDSDLVPYDMPEEDEHASKVKAPTQLHDCATYLRKEDNPDMVEKALHVVGNLVVEMPEELDLHAADLAHALLHVKCSSVAVEGEEDVAEKRQRDALLALLACSPVNTVTALTSELFSPHIDISQRILILDIMGAGARAISNGVYKKKKSDERRKMQLITDMPTGLESSSWIGPGSDAGPPGAGPWKEVSYPLLGDRFVGWGTSYERELPSAEGKIIAGKSRKWGHRSRQLREEGRMQRPTLPQSNAFATLAPLFMLPVMKEYDVKRHGVDLLERDYLVLGATLSMLAECMKCIPMEPQAALLGTALLEMLRSREISTHKEPFVRRAALNAASCVMGSLNPSDVVASLTSGVGNMSNNLEWVRGWALDAANNDSDKECSMVAVVCLHLHSEMAMQAMRSMETYQLSEETLEMKLNSSSSSVPIIMPFHESSARMILGP